MNFLGLRILLPKRVLSHTHTYTQMQLIFNSRFDDNVILS